MGWDGTGRGLAAAAAVDVAANARERGGGRGQIGLFAFFGRRACVVRLPLPSPPQAAGVAAAAGRGGACDGRRLVTEWASPGWRPWR